MLVLIFCRYYLKLVYSKLNVRQYSGRLQLVWHSFLIISQTQMKRHRLMLNTYYGGHNNRKLAPFTFGHVIKADRKRKLKLKTGNA